MGRVVGIYVAPEARAAPLSMDEVRAVAGRGLEGDRYFHGAGTWSDRRGPQREVTLIESEAVEAMARDGGVDIDPGLARRNIVTAGVALNHLVGKEFAVGEVRLLGVKLCEPCAHLEGLSKPGVLRGLIHRGGLNAQILAGGTIRVGDPITP